MPREIEFHTGVADKLGYTCRLLRKAYLKGARVVVSGAPEALSALDQALWTFEAQGFVPHARLHAGQTPPDRLARTPLWLIDPGASAPHRDVAVNLGPEPVPDVAAYARVIEVVAADDADRAQGRRRWRAYEAQGLPIKHHAQRADA